MGEIYGRKEGGCVSSVNFHKPEGAVFGVDRLSSAWVWARVKKGEVLVCLQFCKDGLLRLNV